MQNAFALLNLPPIVLKTTLQSMDTLEQISLSFVSKRTKTLVECLNLTFDMPYIEVSRRFVFECSLGGFFPSLATFILCPERNETPAPLMMTDSVKISTTWALPYYWRKEGYGIRDWIDHLMTIFHASTIGLISFSGQEEAFELSSIKNVIHGLDISTLNTSDCSTNFQQTLIETFPMSCIALKKTPYQNPTEMHKIFMQNYDGIDIYLESELKLDDLQMMNSKAIVITSDEDNILQLLNKFLKLWKKGSNPRLEYLHFDHEIENFTVDVNVVLKGIRHQVVPNEVMRTFKLPHWSGRIEEISGGFDIHDVNGRRATLHTSQERVDFVVWPQ